MVPGLALSRACCKKLSASQACLPYVTCSLLQLCCCCNTPIPFLQPTAKSNQALQGVHLQVLNQQSSELPGLTAVATMAQPANLVAFKVWLSRFFALLISFALPSSGSVSTLFNTTTMSLVASSPTTKHSAVYRSVSCSPFDVHCRSCLFHAVCCASSTLQFTDTSVVQHVMKVRKHPSAVCCVEEHTCMRVVAL